MARGIMYEITSETELENAGIFSLSEDDLLDFVGNAFDYCSDKDREEDVPEMMEYLQKFGFITGTDEIETTDGEKTVPYICVTQEAKEAYFTKSYDDFMEKVQSLTITEFASDTFEIANLIADSYGDAACLNGMLYAGDIFSITNAVLIKRTQLPKQIFNRHKDGNILGSRHRHLFSIRHRVSKLNPYKRHNQHNGNSKKDNGDGTYTVTDKTVSTETKGGYLYTYQTTVYSTYDKTGNLISTKKDGPYEISKVAAGGTSATADQSQIASTLDGELARVSGSVSFDTEKASQVLNKLNAERKNQGLNTLSMSASSEAYKLACIRAADMAIYDHSSSSSPMYGTLDSMVSRFNCHSSHPSENIWKASTRSASEIHTRFQANESSRKVRMSNGYSEVGIAIVEKNNQTYVAEIYLN